LLDDHNLYFDPFMFQGDTSFVSGNGGLFVSGCSVYCARKEDIGAGLFIIGRDSEGFHTHVNGLTAWTAENQARMLEVLETALLGRLRCGSTNRPSTRHAKNWL